MSPATTSGEQSLRTRRAIGLVLLSLVLPGSAQFVAGHRALGRFAMRSWALLVGLVVLALLGLLLMRDWTIGVLVWAAPVLRVTAWAVFAGWALLLLDAWRLSRPPHLGRRNRLALTVACLGLVAVAGLGTNLLASGFSAAQNLGTVFEGGGDTEQKEGRYNILLLGVDAAASREGLRPDSINVASIDAATGRTVIFGLPRNLQRAPFPESSPLHELYPDGYVCDEGACMLNGIWTLGEEHADLYPGKDAGLEATREVISETLGLELNYYAMIDMGGFKSIIDTMGGIRLDSNIRVPIGGGSTEVHGYIEPGDDIHLDGYHALWYARSRHDSNDYERMIRQKCVMSAMAKQLDPMTVATKFEDLSKAGKDLLRTDVGTDKLATLAELALKGRALDMTSVNFAPPLIVSADPDFDLVRQKVADSVAAAEALDGGTPPVTTTAAPPTVTEDAEPASAETAATDEPTEEATDDSTRKERTTEPSEEASEEPTADAEATPDEDAWICRVS